MINKNRKTPIQPSTIHNINRFRGGFKKSGGFLKMFATIRNLKWNAVDSLSGSGQEREAGEFILVNFQNGFS
jgi:hypothetical protein